MHIPKKYFHDRTVLAFLSINTFLAVIGSIALLLRLDSNDASNFIVSYRSNLGLDAFSAGSLIDFVYFVIAAIFIWLFHTFLSMRMYTHRKHFSIAVLALATLLLVLIIIVTNALLVLS